MRQDDLPVRLESKAAESASWRALTACGTKPRRQQAFSAVRPLLNSVANPVRARSPDRLTPGSDVTPVTPIWRTGGDDELTGVK